MSVFMLLFLVVFFCRCFLTVFFMSVFLCWFFVSVFLVGILGFMFSACGLVGVSSWCFMSVFFQYFG
jgi:hypothetical protein